jgi:TPR repeat protein
VADRHCLFHGQRGEGGHDACHSLVQKRSGQGFGCDLGAYLRLGEGVAKDPAEAARLFERAAAVGHAGGMRNYAFVLDRGAGVQFNPTRAADCLLTAYRMGSAAAEDSLFTKHESWRVETKKEVQKLLRDYGFYNGEIDGTFRESSFAALRALAAANPVPQKD